ncbi:MAG: division/cell wall cluster transcriptional repressor MraZ [Chloroflexota bacterium]
MFLSQYRHTLDNKGRLIIPARYRELLEDGAYITQGFERNLLVLTAQDFMTVSERVNQMSLTNPTARQLKRLLFSSADFVTMDKMGRILIPQFLREVAQLDSEAMVVGSGTYFEIWSPEAWDEQMYLLKDTDANSQRFEALDISLARPSQP